MDREVIRARFEQIKERALKRADEEARPERTALATIDADARSGAEYPIARWPRRPPRPPKRIGPPPWKADVA